MKKSNKDYWELVNKCFSYSAYRWCFRFRHFLYTVSDGRYITTSVKQNSDAKLGFRLPTQTASSVVIDEPGLESIKAFLDVQFLKRIGLPKYKFLILVMK